MDPFLSSLFGSETKTRILDVLLSHPGEAFHLRGLAQTAGTDPGNTSKLLRSLVGMGLVLARPDGQSVRYSINDRSAMAAPLRQLFASTGSLISDLRFAAEGVDAEYIGVYGSVANGSYDAMSDVDVLVVGDVSTVMSQAAFKAVARRHGRPVNVVAVSRAEFLKNLGEGGTFWNSLTKDKRIDLKGKFEDVTIGKPTRG